MEEGEWGGEKGKLKGGRKKESEGNGTVEGKD